MFAQVYALALTLAFAQCSLKSFIYLGFIQLYSQFQLHSQKLVLENTRSRRGTFVTRSRRNSMSQRASLGSMTELLIVDSFFWGCAIVVSSLLRPTLVLFAKVVITSGRASPSALVLPARTVRPLKPSKSVIHVKKSLPRMG